MGMIDAIITPPNSHASNFPNIAPNNANHKRPPYNANNNKNYYQPNANPPPYNYYYSPNVGYVPPHQLLDVYNSIELNGSGMQTIGDNNNNNNNNNNNKPNANPAPYNYYYLPNDGYVPPRRSRYRNVYNYRGEVNGSGMQTNDGEDNNKAEKTSIKSRVISIYKGCNMVSGKVKIDFQH